MTDTRGRIAGTLAAATLLATAAGCAGIAADLADCDHEKTEAVSLDVDGADALLLDAGAGSLVVEGDAANTDAVSVRGTGCVSDEDRLDDLRVVAERSGGQIRVRVEYPEVAGHTDGRMDLVVRVPEGMHLRGEDGSGGARLVGLGDVEFTDGSGPLTVRDAGRVTIFDGSGSATVEGVASLDLDDGSGSIEIRDVAGDLDVRDGSGSLRISGVAGSVRIEDGSGSVDLADVDGSVEVEDGSGSLRIARVGGDVALLSTGSGGVDLQDVAGSVRGADR